MLSTTELTIFFFRLRYRLSIQDGCIWKGQQLVLPQTLRKQYLEILHEQHWGEQMMILTAKEPVWWPTIETNIKELVQNYITCQSMRNKPIANEFKYWPKLNQPLERIHLDHADWKGVKLLICTDSFSKHINAWIVKSTNIEETCRCLNKFFNKYGYPKTIVSDNGSPFKGECFIRFCVMRGIQLIHSRPCHSASNGLADKSVQTIKMAQNKK